MNQIELIKAQIDEIDKKIEEFSIQNNSPILTIPGILHSSGTSILAELGDMHNYSKPSQIITPGIQCNSVFKEFYQLKISQDKGHCVRKLMRVIFYLLSTNTQFDPALLR